MKNVILVSLLVLLALIAGYFDHPVATKESRNDVSSQRAEFKNGLNTITPTEDIGLQHAVK